MRAQAIRDDWINAVLADARSREEGCRVDNCSVQFDKLPWWKQRSIIQDCWVLCHRILAQPGARQFLDDFEVRARAEGLLSPALLAAMDEPDELDTLTEEAE